MSEKKAFELKENTNKGISFKCRTCPHRYTWAGMFVNKELCNHPKAPFAPILTKSDFDQGHPDWCPEFKNKFRERLSKQYE